MRKEVLDLLKDDRGQVLGFPHVRIIGEGRIHGHTDQFFVAAMLVFQVQHADRAGAHHATGNEGRARDHQRVQRIAIGRKRVRHEAVIGGIAHRRMQDAVDEQRARCLVEFILHRFAASRHFDDDVEAFGRIVANGNLVDIHGAAI